MNEPLQQQSASALKSIMMVPLEADQANALRNLISGGVLCALGIGFAILTLTLVSASTSTHNDSPIGLALICPAQIVLLSLVPLIMGAVGIRRRRLTVHPRTLLPPHLECLRHIRWPIRRIVLSNTMADTVLELAASGTRVVADGVLARWTQVQEVPQGLLEPMPLQAARPISGLRTTVNLAVLFLAFLLLIPSVFVLLSRGMQPGFGLVVAISLVGLFLIALVKTIIQLPSLQRQLVDVPILGGWARGGWRQLGAVAGPGWVRVGKHVWQAERDILLIRRRGRDSPSTSLEVMLAGEPGTLRFVVAGCDDPMLGRLWSAWLSPEVRPELAFHE